MNVSYILSKHRFSIGAVLSAMGGLIAGQLGVVEAVTKVVSIMVGAQ